MKIITAPLLAFLLFACRQSPTVSQETKDLVGKSAIGLPAVAPPAAEKVPKTLTNLGESRIDNYYWLNQRDNPKVRQFLDAENRYCDSALAPVAGLRQRLFEEMKARIQEDDASVPFLKNGFWYYTRLEKGKEYAIHCRKKSSLDSAEEIMLDGNKVAEGHDYTAIQGLEVSPDNRLLFFCVDHSGRGLFKFFIKDLTTGQLLADSGDTGSLGAWANDSKTLFYDTRDKVTLRNDKIWRHTVGQPVAKDKLVYEEKDETQYAYLGKTKSEKYIVVNSAYTQTVEVHVLDADAPMGEFKLIKPREKEVFYNVDHAGDQFFIKTNLGGAKNFRLMTAPAADPRVENWKDFLPHRPDVLLKGVALFKDHLVAEEQKDGHPQIRVIRLADRAEHYVDFGEPTYAVDLEANPEFDTRKLRYAFSSPKTPETIVEHDMESKEKKVLKTQPVLGGFDPKNYETEWVMATAKDGTRVPISLLYKKGMAKNGKNPCFLTGYGSYGYSYDAGFNRDVFSLADRGFVCAIAHIRGGMEFGYQWYEDGKMGKKMNTFTDFIACAEHLVEEKYTSPDRLFARGVSAGGLLMGAVANLRPDLFRGIAAAVPFVDVLTTMSDPSIPLTTGEYTEWGNPAVAAEWAVMKSYSPYDNVAAKNYPAMLVTTSLGDSQVQYFEPAKWVAKLRETKTDNNPLLFYTNMAGSHGGSSGRFKRLEDTALYYGWMLGLLGMTESPVKH